VFMDDDNTEDQFVPLTSVEWILQQKELHPEQSEHDTIHEEIHREHSLLSSRMNWYVTSQSFLFAAFAVAGDNNYTLRWMSRFIPAIGITITALIMVSILAGLLAMSHLRRLKAYNSNCFGAPVYFHWFGVGAPCFIPVFLLVAWIVAFNVVPR
jgi:hypothetical protein